MRKILSLILSVIMVLTMLTGCGTTLPAADQKPHEPEANYAGTYTGSAPGYHGELNVEVKLDEAGKIISVDVDKNHGETQGIGTISIEKVPAAIIAGQSLKIDSVSGATLTKDAIVAAVANALKEAGINPDTYGYEASASGPEQSDVLDMSTMPIKQAVTGTITVTDAKGRDVTLEFPISTYAISTMDVVDFIIPLMGGDAFNKLVASGQDGGGGIQTYQKLYTSVVGDYMKHVGQISDHNAPFDLEMILAMDPDVLIVNSAMGAHNYAMEIEQQLSIAGIPVVLIDVPGKSFTTSVQDTLKLLGQIFQKEDRAAEVSDFIDRQYELIASKKLSERDDKPTVYYEKSGYSEIFGSTSTSKSGWGAVIAAAGGDNIADPLLLESAAGKGGNNTLDPEYVIQSDPDFIILSGSGAGWMDNYPGSEPEVPKFDIINRTGWSNLKAVKNNNVCEIAHAMSRSVFGFHAAMKMASVFYPEEFKDVDADAIINEFFEKFMLVDSSVTGWMYRISGVQN